MTAGAVIAVMLVAGACHAGWNLVAKRTDADRTLLLMVASGLIVVTLAPWALTHLPTQSVALAIGCVALRGVLNAVYLVALSKSYHHFDLSLAYPLVRGTGPVVATVLAIAILGERPELIGLAGLAVTSLAILAMAATGRRTPGSEPPGSERPAGERHRLEGAAAVLLTGVTIGAYTVVDKVGVRYWEPVAYFCFVELTGLAVVGVYLVRRRQVGELIAVGRRHLPSAAVCAVLIGTSYVLALYALQHSLASYIAPLREVSVLFGAALGMLILKEDHGAKRIVAAAGIVVGLVLVGLALG